MAKDPQAVANKWSANLGAATQYITDGVNRVTVAPGQKAAAAADLWLQRVQASRAKWQARVGAVSLADWQHAMTTKGVGRIASGATAAVPKMQSFLADFLPFQERVTASTQAMPKGTLEQGIARAANQIRGTAQYQRGTRSAGQ
jgi:hypothetical protein